MIKVLSLDLQGTLSDSKFSDYFWLELLPLKYANKYHMSIQDAKNYLKNKFKEIGVYDRLYYDDKYWSELLGFDTVTELKNMELQPTINMKLYNYIKRLNIPVIILSTTTDIFINYELKSVDDIFYKKYSCMDYFNVAGKTNVVYSKLCEELNIKQNELLHIGDSKIMDIDNAKLAGVKTIYYDQDTDKLIKLIGKELGED